MLNKTFKILNDNIFVLAAFSLWRILLFVPTHLAPYFFEKQKDFIGPYPWANFDGEHYLSIAKMGYANGEQAFFPLYPILIQLLGGGFWAGFIISNLAFLVALVGLYKLLKLDFSEKIAKLSVILLLIFPGNFFFGSVYTESLFLCLVVWSLYSYRCNNFLLSGIIGMFASATRVVGIILLPILVFDLLVKKIKLNFSHLSLLFQPLGLISYIYYSLITWNDPIKFFTVASGFGEQRSSSLILLPQVFYRYFVKIIPNLSWDYFPVVFTTLMEIGVAIMVIWLIVYGFKRIPITYSLLTALVYLIPTLSGSFSSLPRYIIVSFPIYILIAKFFNSSNIAVKTIILITLILISCIMQMLFVQGFFVS